MDRRWTVLVCAALAALSLLVWHTPAYDPTAWLIWGRQLTDGFLDTVGGPSWKPLPVGLTTVFSLLGTEAAAWLWLWLARFAGLLGIVLVAATTRRLGGDRTAGWIAGGAFTLATDVQFNCFRGDSEGLLVCTTLLAVLAHLDDRTRLALLLGAVAGLIRPEVWPLLAAYGLWLMWRRRDAATIAYVLATGAAVLALWLLPERLTSGESFRAASRAQNPVPGSPGQSAFPFGMTFVVASIMLVWPVYVGAVVRVRDAWRARETPILVVAAGSTVLMLMVAVGAELGFTGNLRYSTLPATGLCVLGGLGLPRVVAALRERRRLRALLGAAAGVAVAVSAGVLVWGGIRLQRDEVRYGSDLPALLDRAGGLDGIRACGPLAASPFERQAVAWRLGIRQRDVSTRKPDAGTLIARPASALVEGSPLPLVAETDRLQLRMRCRT